jgi:hypothetical protein
MNYNPFDFEPTDDDLALTAVDLVDDDGNLIGFDAPAYEDPGFEVDTLPEFTYDDDDCPDELYDLWASLSGTN